MSRKSIYEPVWEELSDAMRAGIQDHENASQVTVAALWKRDLLGPGDRFTVVLTEKGKGLLRWAKKHDKI